MFRLALSWILLGRSEARVAEKVTGSSGKRTGARSVWLNAKPFRRIEPILARADFERQRRAQALETEASHGLARVQLVAHLDLDRAQVRAHAVIAVAVIED